MKVLFIPDGRKGNPYQKALAGSLSKESVDVSFGTVFRLFSALRSAKNYWKPDILHLHWHHPFLLAGSVLKTIIKSVSFIGELLALKLFGIKIIWTVHNITSHEGRFSAVELFFSKLLAQICDKILVHSQFAKYEVQKMDGVIEDSQILVIPHGNYINSYENVIKRSKARNQLQIVTGDFLFLYFGQIRPYKGVSELINAFKKLDNPQATLLIAGKPCNNEISEDILKRCDKNENIKTIFEFIPDDEIQIYMNAVDVVVLPYRDILTSGAAILAMSFGRAVIAPAIGCMPDVLDKEGSFLYNPSEKNGLLTAMQRALGVDLIKMGKHNFQLAKQLQWDDIARQTYQVYQECLRERRREKVEK